MSRSTRRDFLKGALATGALAAAAPPAVLTAATTQKRSATDWVTLGKSGVKVLEEPHPFGNSKSRAAMIEGPDAIAIELIEMK